MSLVKVPFETWHRAASRDPSSLMVIHGEGGNTWWDLREDVKLWLRRNGYTHPVVTWNADSERWEIEMYPQTALVFKLTWVGV